MIASKAQRQAHRATEAPETGAKKGRFRGGPSSSTLYLSNNESGKTFAEILKEMKHQIVPADRGVNIQRISETRLGGIQLKFKESNGGAARSVIEKVCNIAGPQVSCRHLMQTRVQ